MKKAPSETGAAQHRGEMKKLQDEMREKIRAARTKRGLLIVHTGNGKGKTTAAMGMLVRMLSHKKRCAVIQFIKTGSDPVARLLAGPNLAWHRVGEGFTWDTQDREADIARCREGWKLALGFMSEPEVKFLLLDELNVVLAYNYLPVEEVLETLTQRRTNLHVVVTGRDAPPQLLEAADLVTEMREIKHPFHAGIAAQAGIEF